jgi:MauM/NapG family ferredoxin protein
VRTRRLVQGASLILFLWLFAISTTQLASFIPPDLFLKGDPLAGIHVFLISWGGLSSFVPALAVVFLSLIAGRAFCGWICPLGTIFDLMGKLRRGTNRDPRWLLSKRAIPLFSLGLVLSSALFGLSLIGWMDPLVILTRSVALILEPWIMDSGAFVLRILRPLAQKLDWFWLWEAQISPPRFWLTGLSLAWMGTILCISVVVTRLWCRAFCPLGGMLGLLGSKAPISRKVTDSCTECGACQRVCPSGAIGDDPRASFRFRCIACLRCQEVCPVDAIYFSPASASPKAQKETRGFALSRRGLLAVGAAGLIGGLTVRTDAGRVAPRDRLIRPPGALPEGMFLEKCLRCGLCMSVCMSKTIQPSLWEAGLNGVWTPRLDLRLAPCEKHCNRCGKTCPTGAIRPLSLEERIHAKIGTAVLLRERCLVWEQDKVCLVCDEICPYDAIEFREVEGKRRPFVTENRCNGCGYCEHKCPVQGESAIVVVRMGEIRLEAGSYKEEAKKRGFVFEEARGERGPTDGGSGEPERLPPGFLRP